MKLKKFVYHGLISIFIVSLLTLGGCKGGNGTPSNTASGSAK